jgi:hypothetical protein
MPTIPSPPTAEAAALRARAAALRRLASHVEHADLGAVARLAGDDTWIGATAEACRHDVAIAIRRLDGAADELRRAAATLERRADHLLAVAPVARS